MLEGLLAAHRRYEELSAQLSQPDAASDIGRYRALMKEYKELEPLSRQYLALAAAEEALAEAKELLYVHDAELSAMAAEQKNEAEAEIARIKAISDKLGKVVERMTNGLSEACQRLNIEKLDGLHAQISFRKSEQTIIDNIEALPKEYINEKVTYTANKALIKAALKAGEVIDGAHIETVKNIQIK